MVGGAALGGGQARPHSTWFSACLPGLGGLNPVCGWDGGGMGGAPVCPGLGVCTRWVGGKKKGVGFVELPGVLHVGAVLGEN